MRRTKTIEADRTRHRKNQAQRLIVIWAVFLLSAAAVFLWARTENQRIITEYEQSVNCQLPGEKNCREVLDAVVAQVSPIYGSVMPNRFGGANSQKRSVISIDLDIVVSDGWKSTARLSKEEMFQPELEPDANKTYSEVFQLEDAEKGYRLTVTRWNNKIIMVRIPDSTVDVYTVDHPLNDWIDRFLPLRSVFILLLIVLLIWTSYEILRKQR